MSDCNKIESFLSRSAQKLDMYEFNDIDVAAVEEEFLSSMSDYMNSDKYTPEDFSEQVVEYKRMIGLVSEIPLGALWQHLNLCRTVLDKISELFEQDGLSDILKWHVNLFFVVVSNIQGLRERYNYEFDTLSYPENDPDAFWGIDNDKDPDVDASGYAAAWIGSASVVLGKAMDALNDGDLVRQNLYLSDLFNVSVVSSMFT